MADTSRSNSESNPSVLGSLGSWFRKMCCSVLQSGPMPRHIAIIMDGNRRFAKKTQRDRSMGHVMGFEKLVEV